MWFGRVTLRHSSFLVLHLFIFRFNFNFLISCRRNGTLEDYVLKVAVGQGQTGALQQLWPSVEDPPTQSPGKAGQALAAERG